MKTTITAPANDRRAFRTSKGLRTVEAGHSVSVDGLTISEESRAKLDAGGWVFEDEGVEPGVDAPVQDEPASAPAPKRVRSKKSNS